MLECIEWQLLHISRFSRPGLPMTPQGIAIHYTGYPGQSPRGVRNYFDGLIGTQWEYKPDPIFASAHLCVGLDGSCLGMIPLDEVAWHAGPKAATRLEAKERWGEWPNKVLLGMELCHPGPEGRFTFPTWETAVGICADLCQKFQWDTAQAITIHNAITGKDCPRWFVTHPDFFGLFIADVTHLLQKRA